MENGFQNIDLLCLIFVELNDLQINDLILNLGTVLETWPGTEEYSVVIHRLDEKQVIRFPVNQRLVVIRESIKHSKRL